MQQLARAVMRRDLALLREQASQEKPLSQTEPVKAATPTANGADRAEVPHDGLKLDEQPVDETVKPEPNVAPPAPMMEPITEPAVEEQNSTGDLLDTDMAMSGDGAAPEATPAEALPPQEAPQDESKPPDSGLQVKTDHDEMEDLFGDGGDATDDDKAPDTANISDARDLDSLFNDPVSAGGAVGSGEENTDFASGFDFGSFNASLDNNAADTDNLEGLLPGLQDYANTQPVTTEPDFEALFAPDPTFDSQNANMNGQPQDNGEQHDSTFDDFNFAQFTGGDYGNGNEGNGGNVNDEDFDFNFE